jgi:hypothetical protein
MDILNICDRLGELKLLQLFDECFRINYKSDVLAEFCCLKDLSYPVDGFDRKIDVVAANTTLTIFDNNYDEVSPVNQAQLVSRAILLFVKYPVLDSNGEEIDEENKNVGLTLFDYNNNSFTIPLFNFWSWFGNTATDNKVNLLNKVELVNNNDFDITASRLVLLGNKDGVSLDNTYPGC